MSKRLRGIQHGWEGCTRAQQSVSLTPQQLSSSRSLGNSISPSSMWALFQDTLLSFHCGTRTSSIACHSSHSPSGQSQSPRATSSSPQTALLLLCSGWVDRGCCSWRGTWGGGSGRQQALSWFLEMSLSKRQPPTPWGSQEATRIQKFFKGPLRIPPLGPQEHQSKAFTLKVRELILIEYDNACKAYGSNIYTIQTKLE